MKNTLTHISQKMADIYWCFDIWFWPVSHLGFDMVAVLGIIITKETKCKKI